MDSLRLRARELRNHATDAERCMWQQLRLKRLGGFRFRRQVPIAGYIIDFVCLDMKLIIELDGGQHVDRIPYDDRRTAALQALGYRVVRYWNDEVLLRMDDVLEDVMRALGVTGACGNNNSTPPQPSPSLREREGASSNSQSNPIGRGDGDDDDDEEGETQ